MPDDTVTTSWKRFTDKLIRLWGEPAEDHFTEIRPAPVLQHRGLTARHAEAQPATSQLQPMNIDDRPTRSSSAVDALSAAVGRPADRDEETTRQVAQLAAWEDEGGAKHCGKTAL